MTRFSRVSLISSTLLLLIAAAPLLRADVHVTVKESSEGTTLRWTGKLDVRKLHLQGQFAAPEGSLFPQMGIIASAGGSPTSKMDVYQFPNIKLKTFGNGRGVINGLAKGSAFMLTNTLPNGDLCVCLPAGYKGEKLEGEITFPGATLASLGISKNPITYDLGADSIYLFPQPQSKGLFTSLKTKTKKKQQIGMKLSLLRSEPIPATVPSVSVRPLN